MIDWSIYLALNKGGSKVKGNKVQKTGGIKTGVARGGGGGSKATSYKIMRDLKTGRGKRVKDQKQQGRIQGDHKTQVVLVNQ